MIILPFSPETILSFEWDLGNLSKNNDKHGVDYRECEEIFFNQPLVLLEDLKHSKDEQRYCALGRTNADRGLFIIFTFRNNMIRVISARDQHKKERSIYGAS